MCSSHSTSTLSGLCVLADIPYFLILRTSLFLCQSCDATSPLIICIKQNLEQVGHQECYYNDINAILHHFQSSPIR